MRDRSKENYSGTIFPFRWALPLGELALCMILLWPIRRLVFVELHLPYTALLDPLGFFGYIVPPAWTLGFGLKMAAVLNVPGALLVAPTAILTHTHQIWKPAGVNFDVWNAVTWPIAALVFWWIAGRGAEAWSAWQRGILRPKISVVEAVIGFLFVGIAIAFTVGFVFFSEKADRADPQLQLFLVSMVLWGFLGSLSTSAKFAQWRLRKRMDTALVASQSPS